MTIRSETGTAAATSPVVVEPPIAASPPWKLRRQRSVPAAVVATFAPCVGIGRHQPPPRRVLRLGGNNNKAAAVHVRGGGEEEEGDYHFDSGRGGGGGGVGVLRALWRRIVRGRRWKVMSRSGSSTARRRKQCYAQEEYEQNFDEGAARAAAAGEPEPEYLSRSFSARYAGGGRRRSAGMAIWGGVAR